MPDGPLPPRRVRLTDAASAAARGVGGGSHQSCAIALTARYACSIAQLVMGLAEIMGWRNIPERRNKAAVARFVKAHRASVQRWLDWLGHAGLVSHTPQQDEEGFWWRTVIELHPCPQLPA